MQQHRFLSQFKTTLLSRRFPGLQSLPDKDIRDLILADRKAAGRRLAAPTKTHPKKQFSPLPCKREQWPAGSQQPAFIYVNPAQAKEDVRRPEVGLSVRLYCDKLYNGSAPLWFCCSGTYRSRVSRNATAVQLSH